MSQAGSSKIMENNPINILISGKMGDFIHCMYVPYHLWKTRGIKSNIYISNNAENFEHGLEKTFQELRPIVLIQDYIENFEIWNGQNIHFFTPLFRDSRFVFKNCWKEMLCRIFFNNEKPLDGGWMSFDSQEKFNGTLVINRKNKIQFTSTIKNHYSLEISKFSKAIFAGDQGQFDQFELNNLCEYFSPKSLNDWFSIISKGSFFLGNQSGPAAIASALDRPRLVELSPNIDAIHYLNESLYSNNLSFIVPLACKTN